MPKECLQGKQQRSFRDNGSDKECTEARSKTMAVTRKTTKAIQGKQQSLPR